MLRYAICVTCRLITQHTGIAHCLPVLQWHRTATTQETDGFQVKRPGDQNVKCTLLLMLDYQVDYHFTH